MDWSKKIILITGASGFIGSHLTERVVELGAKVKAFIRYNSRGDLGFIESFLPQIRKEIEIIQGDLRDPEAIRKAMKNVDIVFHLGALIAIPYSYLHPTETIETNILGTLNVLNAAKEIDLERLVHTSSSEVYGTAQYVPIDERHPLQGQSPYSASKIGADMIAESFYRSYNLPVTTIRPFNTYGPRQSARAVIPTILTQVLTSNEVSLGSLEPRRDFTYVDDTVEGLLKGVDSDKAIGEVINIGSGKEVAIGEIAQKIISLLGKKVKIKIDKGRIRPKKSEVERLCASNKKAKELLCWQPKVHLNEGLNRTISWVSENIERYKPGYYQV